MRKFSAAFVVVMLASTAPAICKSESHNKQDKKQDKKQLLVDQIIDAMETESKLSEDELAELKKKQQERMDRIIDKIADSQKLSDEEKAKLKQKLKDKFAEKKPERPPMPPEVKEQMEKRFDFKNFAKQTTYQVLADHLDDSDLKTILKFIKSSTGEKLLHQAPDMMGEAAELALEKYVPIFIELWKEHRNRPGLNLPPGGAERRQMLEKIRQMLKEKLPQGPGGPAKNET